MEHIKIPTQSVLKFQRGSVVITNCTHDVRAWYLPTIQFLLMCNIFFLQKTNLIKDT